MNKGELIGKVAENANLTKAQASEAVNCVLDAIKGSLKDDDKVAILGFGTFSVTHKPARTGRNPRTGESMQIKAKNVVKFKPGKELAESVN